MRRVVVIVACLLLLPVLVWGQGAPRTPNLALKFTRDTTTNDNFVRLDDVLGSITDYPTSGQVTAAVRDTGGTVYHVKAYGAVCDGTTNDTSAIQSAINAAALGDKRNIVQLVGGTCCAAGLIASDKPVTLRGANAQATILKKCASTTDSDILTVANTTAMTGMQIEDLRFDCNGSTTKDGVVWENVELGVIERSYFTSCRYGLHLKNGARFNVIAHSTFGSDNTYGLYTAAGADQNRFIGNWVDENTSRGASINASGWVIVGNDWQDNTGSSLFLEAGGSHIISGNIFHKGSTPSTAYAIRNYADEVTIAANHFLDQDTLPIQLESGADNNRINANYFDRANGAVGDSGSGNRINDLPLTDSPATCAADTNGTRYFDKSMGEACVCNSSHSSGARWCQQDGGGCTSDTSCG